MSGLISNNIPWVITGVLHLEYDSRNFLTKVSYPSGRYLAFSYNQAGKRTRMVDQDGYELIYVYDQAGRLSDITDGEGRSMVSYGYDEQGRLKEKQLENGVYTTYAYDVDGRLTSLVNYRPNGEVLSSFDYVYDINGRRSSMTPLDGTYQYQYDANGQLIGVTYPDGRTASYSYDSSGNRISATEAGIQEAYTNNNMNQYTRAGDETFTYDEDGNLISRTKDGRTTVYRYGPENHLIGVTSDEGDWHYTYDTLGNRIASEHNGKTTHYLLDPGGLVNVVAEYDEFGNRLAGYVHGLGLAARIDGEGNPAYYTFDGNGNTSKLVGPDLSVLNSYTYAPFGQVLATSESVDNPFGYVGQFGVMHEGNGLLFMRARHYDAKLGRFMHRDPIRFEGGDVNRYRIGRQFY
ncbi:MAG: RHS repeat-associated core domain-containing protein [bacterium]